MKVGVLCSCLHFLFLIFTAVRSSGSCSDWWGRQCNITSTSYIGGWHLSQGARCSSRSYSDVSIIITKRIRCHFRFTDMLLYIGSQHMDWSYYSRILVCPLGVFYVANISGSSFHENSDANNFIGLYYARFHQVLICWFFC